MTDIEFSDWYFLFLSPFNSENNGSVPLSLKATPPRPSTAREITESLSEKLKVPQEEFSIISIEEYRVRIYLYKTDTTFPLFNIFIAPHKIYMNNGIKDVECYQSLNEKSQSDFISMTRGQGSTSQLSPSQQMLTQ